MAYFCKKRQKKNRKGCYTFTVYRYFSSNMQIFDFYLLGAKSPCTKIDFFNRLSTHSLFDICKQKSLLTGNTANLPLAACLAYFGIKIPPNFKKRSRRDFKAWQISSPKHRFFYSVGLSYLWLYKTKPINCDFSQVHRLCI